MPLQPFLACAPRHESSLQDHTSVHAWHACLACSETMLCLTSKVRVM